MDRQVDAALWKSHLKVVTSGFQVEHLEFAQIVGIGEPGGTELSRALIVEKAERLNADVRNGIVILIQDMTAHHRQRHELEGNVLRLFLRHRHRLRPAVLRRHETIAPRHRLVSARWHTVEMKVAGAICNGFVIGVPCL
jgi:hypothetical protein